MRRAVEEMFLLTINFARMYLAREKEHLLRCLRIARIQVKHPMLRCHHTVDIRVDGELFISGPVNVGRNSKIYVRKGAQLTFGGCNMILDNVIIEALTEITVGEHVSIQDCCHILGQAQIGQGTLLAPRVFICSSMHSFRGQESLNVWPWQSIRLQDRILARAEETVNIGKDCWLGINATFLPGSGVNDGCIVGASSVVIGYQEKPYAVYAGNPARLIGHRWVNWTRQISSTTRSTTIADSYR